MTTIPKTQDELYESAEASLPGAGLVATHCQKTSALSLRKAVAVA